MGRQAQPKYIYQRYVKGILHPHPGQSYTTTKLLNEGSGVSIDDAVTEMQATFVARFVEPWQAVKAKDWGLGTI